MKIGILRLIEQTQIYQGLHDTKAGSNHIPSSNFKRKKIDGLANASDFTPIFLKNIA